MGPYATRAFVTGPSYNWCSDWKFGCLKPVDEASSSETLSWIELQRLYQEKTALCSSIGYGKTLQEVTIALRLAKAKKRDSIVGVALE